MAPVRRSRLLPAALAVSALAAVGGAGGAPTVLSVPAPPPGGVTLGLVELRLPAGARPPRGLRLSLPKLPQGVGLTAGVTDFRVERVGGRPTLVAQLRIAAWAHRSATPGTPLVVRVPGPPSAAGGRWVSAAWSQKGPEQRAVAHCDPSGPAPSIVTYLADFRAVAPRFAEIRRAISAICEREPDAATQTWIRQRLGGVFVTPDRPGDVTATGSVTAGASPDAVVVTVRFSKRVSAFVVKVAGTHVVPNVPYPTGIVCDQPSRLLHPEHEDSVHCWAEAGIPGAADVRIGLRRADGSPFPSPAGVRVTVYTGGVSFRDTDGVSTLSTTVVHGPYALPGP